MMNNIEIKPVIELFPTNFSKSDYDHPNGTASELPDAWVEYWLKSLADAGITDVRPSIKGDFFANISDISEADLENILKTTLKDVPINEIPCFDGGVIIFADDDPIVIPQCCVSLSDYKHWIEVADKAPEQWKQIWIGHPMVYIRVSNGKLQFSEYTENNKPSGTVVHEIDFQSFKAAVQVAVTEVNTFEKRIHKILDNLKYSNAKNIAYSLTND